VTDEASRAQLWRQAIMGLSVKQLAQLTGYSVAAIRCFEANSNTAGEPLGEAAWQRYRNACAGAVMGVQDFDWTQGGDRAREQR
jgi:hypothetical protein